MAVDGIKVMSDLQSKKFSWDDLKIPQWLIDKLVNQPVMFKKPSLIQAASIPAIMDTQEKRNFIF